MSVSVLRMDYDGLLPRLLSGGCLLSARSGMYLYVIQLKLLNLCRQCVPITVELGQCVLLPVILLLLLPSFSYCESNCDDRLLLRLFIFLSPPPASA